MEKRIIFFHGKSDLTVRKRIAKIIEKQIPAAEREMAVTQFRRYESGSQKGTEVTEALLSLPLGCSRQLVVVWQYQNFFSFPHLRKLLPLIPDNTWVVFASETSLPEGEKKKLSLVPEVEVITEYFVKWDAVRHHLQLFFQEYGLKANREVMDHLIKIFSESPIAMDRELEKIAVYFNPGQQVTKASLQGILSLEQGEQIAYGVVNTFFEKKVVEVLKKFRQYLEGQGDLPLLIMVMIRELTLMIKFKEMKNDKIPLPEIFRHLGVIYTKHQQALQAKDVLFTYGEIVRILEGCFSIDKGLRQESFVNRDMDRPRVPLRAKLHFERILTVGV